MSSKLIQLDEFTWERLKGMICLDLFENSYSLLADISEVVAAVLVLKAIQQLSMKARKFLQLNGGQFEHVLYIIVIISTRFNFCVHLFISIKIS